MHAKSEKNLRPNNAINRLLYLESGRVLYLESGRVISSVLTEGHNFFGLGQLYDLIVDSCPLSESYQQDLMKRNSLPYLNNY